MHRLSPLLAAATLLLAAPEGRAGGTVIVHSGTVTHHHRFAAHRHVSRFPFTTRFGNQLAFGFNTFGRFGSFGPFDTFAPFAPLFSDGFAAPVAVEPPATAAPPGLLALNAPPPPPRRSAVDERPTVEMTQSGVQIVRGPGARHTGW